MNVKTEQLFTEACTQNGFLPTAVPDVWLAGSALGEGYPPQLLARRRRLAFDVACRIA